VNELRSAGPLRLVAHSALDWILGGRLPRFLQDPPGRCTRRAMTPRCVSRSIAAPSGAVGPDARVFFEPLRAGLAGVERGVPAASRLAPSPPYSGGSRRALLERRLLSFAVAASLPFCPASEGVSFVSVP